MQIPKAPEGYNTVNPFIITRRSLELIEFLKTAFKAEEDMASHTMDEDGLLLHAELIIGNSRVAVAETKPGWPQTPSLLQVYVEDAEAVLKRAQEKGAEIVTKPTDFYGDTFSRFIDPFGNLWWVYQHNPQADAGWSESGDDQTWSGDESSEADAASWEPSEEMRYIHGTLLDAMKRLGNSQSI